MARVSLEGDAPRHVSSLRIRHLDQDAVATGVLPELYLGAGYAVRPCHGVRRRDLGPSALALDPEEHGHPRNRPGLRIDHLNRQRLGQHGTRRAFLSGAAEHDAGNHPERHWLDLLVGGDARSYVAIAERISEHQVRARPSPLVRHNREGLSDLPRERSIRLLGSQQRAARGINDLEEDLDIGGRPPFPPRTPGLRAPKTATMIGVSSPSPGTPL